MSTSGPSGPSGPGGPGGPSGPGGPGGPSGPGGLGGPSDPSAAQAVGRPRLGSGSAHAARVPPVAAVLVYLLMGVLYLEAVPPWEVPDEPMHLAYSEALLEGRLPSPGETWEALHPPGYYLWTAFALRAAGAAEIERAPGNPRMPFATAATWHVPGDPAVGLLRMVRALSSQIGILVVAFAWAATRAAFRGAVVRPALAALLVALLPQFLFISHGVTSDTLAAVVGGAAVYVLVGWASGRFGDRRAAAALGLIAVLGVFSKINTLPVLAASVPIAFGLAYARHRSSRGQGGSARHWRVLVVPAAVAVGIVSAAVAIFVVSPELGDRMLEALTWRMGWARPDQARPAAVYEMVARTLESFYGRLGWQTIDLPSATVGVLLGLLAMAAALFGLRRQPAAVRRGLLAASVIVLVSLAAHVKSGMADPQQQGRLLFPALAAVVLLVAQGVWVVVPHRARWAAVACVALCLVAVNVHAAGSLLPRSFAAATGPRPQVDVRVIPLRESTLWLGTTGRDRMWQTFVGGDQPLSRIEIAVARKHGRGDLGMRLEEASGEVLASQLVSLTDLPDSGWVGLDFGPLDDSLGREYRLAVEVDPASKDAWVEVYVTEADDYAEGGLAWTGGSGTDLVMVTYVGEDAPRIVP